MHKIELLDLEFHAYHGVHDFEKAEGNTFWLDIIVHYNFLSAAKSDNLSETVDYEELYRIAKNVMADPVDLLETVAFKVLTRIHQKFPSLSFIEVAVSKDNPPIGGKCRRTRVTISENFS